MDLVQLLNYEVCLTSEVLECLIEATMYICSTTDVALSFFAYVVWAPLPGSWYRFSTFKVVKTEGTHTCSQRGRIESW